MPRYDWCGRDPAQVGVPDPPKCPPIPEALDSAGLGLPPVRADAHGRDEPLLAVEARRIRVIGAYWHTGWPFARPGAYLREQALRGLSAAASSLPDGFGLAIWDAWRDQRLQQRLFDVAYSDPMLPPGFVSPPSDDPSAPPPHSTGGTVDVTLTWQLTPLALGTGFDAFVPTAGAASLEGAEDESEAALSRDLRRLLRMAMVGHGFVQLNCEWWHFEYGTRLWAAVNGAEALYPAHSGPGRR